MTVEKAVLGSPTLKKEQAYIRHQLEVADEESDSAISGSEDCVTEQDEDPNNQSTLRRATSVMSTDGGYISSSDEDKSEEMPTKNVNFIINLSDDNSPLKDEYFNYPTDIQQLFEGMDVGIPDSCKVPIDNKPAWLDMEKIKIGQKFARDNYFGLCFAEMLSLIFLFSVPEALHPLVYTEKSGTPFTAFRRYLSTSLRVQSWFDHDVWNADSLGYRNLKTVRAMHLNVSKRINSVPYNELKDKLTIRGSSKQKPIWCSLKDTLLTDFQSGCPFNFQSPYSKSKIFFNQCSMSFTQFAFTGLMVVYPDKFGAANATDEELDGFIHLWRGLGYLLGIEDKYNFCNGSLQEVRQKCEYIIEKLVKPHFLNVSEDWEHMSRCLVEGISYYTPSLKFEVSVLYLCWVLNIPIPRTTATMSWWHTILFNITKIVFQFSLYMPGMRTFHNWMARKSLMKASSFSTEKLNKLTSKIYDFEKEAHFNTHL